MDLLELQPATRTRYTMADARSRVRSDLAQANGIFIADADVDRWMNEAVAIVAGESQWLQYAATFLTSGGVRDYSLPADCVSISHVQFDIWPLAAVTYQQLFTMNPLWRQLGPALPRYYAIGGASRLTLHPIPSATSGMLVIYAALPPTPLGDLDTFFSPVGGDEALIYYACWKASTKDMGREGAKRATLYQEMWEKSLARIVAQARDLGEAQGLVFGGGKLQRGLTGDGVMSQLWYPPSSYLPPA